MHQCTFCGLNGTGVGFRSKSPGRVTAEFGELQDPDGGAIPARQLALNLAGLFRTWQPLARRHG